MQSRNFGLLIITIASVFAGCADKIYEEGGWKIEEYNQDSTGTPSETITLELAWDSGAELTENDLEITVGIPGDGNLDRDRKTSDDCTYSGILSSLDDSSREAKAECQQPSVGNYVFRIENTTNEAIEVDLIFTETSDDGFSRLTSIAKRSVRVEGKLKKETAYYLK